VVSRAVTRHPKTPTRVMSEKAEEGSRVVTERQSQDCPPQPTQRRLRRESELSTLPSAKEAIL